MNKFNKFYEIARILMDHLLHDPSDIEGTNLLIYNDLIKKYPILEKANLDFSINYHISDWENILINLEKIENRNKIIDNIINE